MATENDPRLGGAQLGDLPLGGENPSFPPPTEETSPKRVESSPERRAWDRQQYNRYIVDAPKQLTGPTTSTAASEEQWPKRPDTTRLAIPRRLVEVVKSFTGSVVVAPATYIFPNGQPEQARYRAKINSVRNEPQPTPSFTGPINFFQAWMPCDFQPTRTRDEHDYMYPTFEVSGPPSVPAEPVTNTFLVPRTMQRLRGPEIVPRRTTRTI